MRNLPDGFVNGFKFVKKGRNRGKIINTWGTAQKPLAKWFNYGTKDKIWIEPLDPDGVLAWPAKGGGGKSSSSIYFKGSGKTGNTLFSKGHYISGQPKTEAMERGIESSKNPLIKQIVAGSKEKFSNE